MKKRSLFLWTLLLSVALLCAQGTQLHIHSLDHDQDLHHSHIAAEVTADHFHLSDVHLSTDVSHGDQHDETVAELDTNSVGLLKNVTSNVLTLALIATLFTLLLPAFYQQIVLRRRDKDVILPCRFLFSPPLRAPPL